MAQRKKKVTDGDAFLEGMLHGVLVKKAFQVLMGDAMRSFMPGDVIKVTAADIAKPGENQFVQCIASRCAGRRDGERKAGNSVAVFSTKELLDKAANEFRQRIIEGKRSDAWGLVDAELAAMNSQGREVGDEERLDALIKRTIGEYDDEIKSSIRKALIGELKSLAHLREQPKQPADK